MICRLCVTIHDQLSFVIEKNIFMVGLDTSHLFHPGFVGLVEHPAT